MAIDAKAVAILSAAAELPHRNTATRPLEPGLEAVLTEIDATVLPRRLSFTAQETTLVLMAGSGRLLRMVEPALSSSEEREEQLVALSSILRAYPSDQAQTVVSEHLEEDVAAEEVGFSPTEIREGLAAEPEAEDEAPLVSEAEQVEEGGGLRAYYDGLDAVSYGQAFLLPNWEEIEITGEDILPESDDDMGKLLAETGALRAALKELCGDQALLMGSDGKSVVSFVFSPEGEVISHIKRADMNGLAERWQRSCLKGEG